ncbi:MAG TPA: hypothetical protein VF553_05595 [Pyrinomonadaceae bacterium]|jgi:hypothetical protein
MPQQNNKPSTAAQRAEEALEKAAPAGKSPARRTLDFLLEGSHDQPAEQDTQPPTMGTQSTQSTNTATASKPMAPMRDFMKVPNSISRDVVPAGQFKGKSKQIYDFFYSKTRGAIVPIMSVRLTRREIMKGANIGSTKTLYINLQHLKQVGLISYQEIVGPHGGNEYTVHLPEEINTMGTQSTNSTLSDSSYSSPKVLGVLRVESTMSTHSSNDENKGDNPPAKTLFKTNTERSDDDEAFAGMLASLRETIVEVTGKRPSSGDAAKLKEIGDLLAAELKIASARTTVSSAPAFLAEHLRRRLRKSDVKQIEREVKEASRETSTVSSTRPELNAEQLQEQVNLMVQLMRDGASIEDVDDQFSSNFRPVQWHMIRGMALTQLGSKANQK